MAFLTLKTPVITAVSRTGSVGSPFHFTFKAIASGSADDITITQIKTYFAPGAYNTGSGQYELNALSTSGQIKDIDINAPNAPYTLVLSNTGSMTGTFGFSAIAHGPLNGNDPVGTRGWAAYVGYARIWTADGQIVRSNILQVQVNTIPVE